MTVGSVPAFAQSVNLAAIRAQCVSADACKQAVAAAIQALKDAGAPQSVINEAVGEIAAEVIEIAQETDVLDVVDVVEVLEEVQEESTYEDQIEEIAEIIEEIEEEGLDEVETDDIEDSGSSEAG
ncbi:hypothetical protein ACMU_13525 [Actibacterium mucosum KCTC 23349]|uniref:Uncharacterized protein n=2 Tax=Actibacterium TaxID=1433986 RepID=A0A037ZLH9_9RHOB|nr:hypothetical protein ACMU_13525 [Actibacterium mucosum KCTC 23349]